MDKVGVWRGVELHLNVSPDRIRGINVILIYMDLTDTATYGVITPLFIKVGLAEFKMYVMSFSLILYETIVIDFRFE